MQEVVTGQDPYVEYRGLHMVMAAQFRKEFPQRPGAFASNQPQGDGRWALLLNCWNTTPSLRPDSPKILEMVSLALCNLSLIDN